MFYLSLQVFLLVYLFLGLLCWLGVVYIPKKPPTFSFVFKSLFILTLIWPLLLYTALKEVASEEAEI